MNVLGYNKVLFGNYSPFVRRITLLSRIGLLSLAASKLRWMIMSLLMPVCVCVIPNNFMNH